MSEIIKSYMGVFLLLLMTLAAGEILAGYMQVLGAQNLHSEILSELEDSNYYSGVVDDAIQRAVAQGYGLSMELYDEDGHCYHISRTGDARNLPGDVVKGEVKLTFSYESPFFGLSQSHVLRGYTA